jgi:hypothetical protein
MRRITFVSLVATMALAGSTAGCGKGGADADGDGKISTREAAAEVSGAVAPRPGQYESKMQLLEIEMPEVAGVDGEQMKKTLQSAMNSTTRHCVTAEDAQNAAKQMIQTPENDNCSYSKFDISGGNVEAVMACKNPDGSTSNMQLSGQMGREQSHMVMALDQAVPGLPGGGKSHFKMQVDSRRIGECT